jgi:type IX secretion system substrate protein
MKKLLILIMAIFTAVATFSQSEMKQKTRNEVKEYISNSVFPLIIQQQKIYLDELSSDEKLKLEEVQNKVDARFNDYCINNSGKRGNRKNGRGRKGCAGNSTMRSELRDEIGSITEVHHKLNQSYEDFIESNKQKWIYDIKKIHEKNNINPIENSRGDAGYEVLINRISNPDFLLLLDPEKPGMMNLRSMKSTDERCRNYNGRSRKGINTELRSEIRTYAVENIIPVVADERSSFDIELLEDERTIIENTRAKIRDRRAMFKQWYASEDFVPGKRAKDPKFESLREDMRSSMKKVREIAFNHKSEIDNCLSAINENRSKWKSDIHEISNQFAETPGETKKGMQHMMHKFNTPVGFLLFNPDEDGMDFLGSKDDIRVIVYPNPVVNNATIAVVGAIETELKVTLFSKDGEQMKVLYDGINRNERLEVELNTAELNSNVYIVKVSVNDSIITRKIIVKK